MTKEEAASRLGIIEKTLNRYGHYIEGGSNDMNIEARIANIEKTLAVYGLQLQRPRPPVEPEPEPVKRKPAPLVYQRALATDASKAKTKAKEGK